MKIVTLFIFLTFTQLTSFLEFHPVHISVTNIDYNINKNAFDLSIKLFADDFEKIINKNYNTTINLGDKNENKNCNKLIDSYIKHHLIIKINNKNLIKNIKLFKKEVKLDENSVWIYYKIKYPNNKLIKNKKIEVVNVLMNDLYNDQKNLFIFTCLNTKEGYNFRKNKIKFEFLIK